MRHLKVDRSEIDDSEFFYNEKEKRKKSLQIKKSEKGERHNMVDGNPFTYKKVKLEKKRHRPKNFKYVKDIDDDLD